MSDKIVSKSIVNSDEVDYLEGLQVDYHNYQDLANLLLSNEKLTAELFEKIKSEYLVVGYKYQVAKDEISKKYAPTDKSYSSWNLDFRSREITYYE